MEYQRIGFDQRSLPASVLLIPVVLLLALVILKPMPLFGGFADDFKYLTGAQCLECLPTNHWERRFAIIWPTGIAIRLFGQNTWSVMLAPVIAGIIALLLTFKLVEYHYGRLAALISACVLALTPVFTDRSMRISIDVIELAFLLGAVLLLQRKMSFFWAGALVAFAVLCRPTQLAALPMIGLLGWWQDRSRMAWFAAGFLFPIAVEVLVYLIAIGDPLYPWKLSLNHMASWKASAGSFDYARFMSPAVDTTESPLFNRAFIDGWAPMSGIDTHWTIQGFVNLLANIECGITLSAAIALSTIAAKQLDRLQIAMIVGAALYFGALTYAFAVDPRPRMFLPIIVIAAALVGSLAPSLWTWPKKIVVSTFVLLIPLTVLTNIVNRSDYSEAAEKADKLLDAQSYMVTSNARQRLALLRQGFPTSGTNLIEIDKRCPPRLAGRWLTQRDGSLCIYTRFPWPFEPYRNGQQGTGREFFFRKPNRC